MKLSQRAESPLYIDVQKARDSGRELTSSLLTSAKLLVTKLSSANLGWTKWVR